MPSFDETDRRILELLLEDARRSFRDIADEVGLSAPSVSSRVENLRDHGVIRRFTVDIDKSRLATTDGCILTASTSPADAESLATELVERETVEYVHRGVDGTIVATVRMGTTELDETLGELAETYPDTEWRTEPLVNSQWEPQLGATEAFGVVCTVCGKTVTDSGETVEIESGDRHVVCCSACATQITDEYERLASDQ